MPGNVGAIEAGLEYQELYGWYRVLEIKSPSGKVRTVSLEDPTAGHFDDVVVRPVTGTAHPPEYLQVKFHVDLSDAYSSDSLMKKTHGLLLQKAWTTWRKLRTDAPSLELHLITTWAWDHTDPLAEHLRDGRLTTKFVSGSVTGKAREVRGRWKDYLESSDDAEFQAFIGSLRFRLSYPATSELMRLVQERMEARGLKSDEESAWRGAKAVREWLIEAKREITEADVNAAIERHDLRDRAEEPSVTMWVHTVVKPAETGADYELDWRELFEGPEDEKGHRLGNPDDWNARLLPELRAMSARIKSEADGVRLLRVRGQARLSPCFAVGYVFRETSGWVIETDQYGQRWRTDAPASEINIAPVTMTRLGDPDVAVLIVSITGDALPAVNRYLAAENEPAGQLVHVAAPTFGREAISSAGDLIAVANAVRGGIQRLDHRPTEVLLFYWGPASGAVFVGHALNAVAPRIQLFEEEFGRYLPSVTLT